MKALLCLVRDSMYLPARVEEEAAVDVDVDASAMPFTEGVVAASFGDLGSFVGVFLVDGLVPLGRADVDAFAEATFDAAMVRDKVAVRCARSVEADARTVPVSDEPHVDEEGRRIGCAVVFPIGVSCESRSRGGCSLFECQQSLPRCAVLI